MSIYFVYAITLLNATGVFAAHIVLSLFALKLGATPFDVGLLAASFSIFPMLLAVTAGRLVDRFGARWPMIFGALAGALGLLVPYFLPALPSLYVAATMTGLAVIFVNLATQNLVGQLSTPETRPRYFANYMLATSAANFLGPLFGGFSIDHFGHATTCLFLAMLALVLITMLLVRGHALPAGTRRPGKAGSGGGIRAMLADPAVRRTLVTGMLINTGINLYQVYMPVYAHSIGLSASVIGMVVAMNSTAAFVSRFALPWLIRKFAEQRVLVGAFLIGAAGLMLIPLFQSAVLLALVSFAFGLGTGCGQPIVIMLMYANSKDGRSGEALGLKFTTNQFTKLASPILFGAIASGLGLLLMFWINATLLALGGYINRPGAGRKPDRGGR
ncbi:MAG: MFS transporter [Burkholderiales bacterium]|nr:MFS transporter [Burkholderiales bacterium]